MAKKEDARKKKEESEKSEYSSEAKPQIGSRTLFQNTFKRRKVKQRSK